MVQLHPQAAQKVQTVSSVLSHVTAAVSVLNDFQTVVLVVPVVAVEATQPEQVVQEQPTKDSQAATASELSLMKPAAAVAVPGKPEPHQQEPQVAKAATGWFHQSAVPLSHAQAAAVVVPAIPLELSAVLAVPVVAVTVAVALVQPGHKQALQTPEAVAGAAAETPHLLVVLAVLEL